MRERETVVAIYVSYHEIQNTQLSELKSSTKLDQTG